MEFLKRVLEFVRSHGIHHLDIGLKLKLVGFVKGFLLWLAGVVFWNCKGFFMDASSSNHGITALEAEILLAWTSSTDRIKDGIPFALSKRKLFYCSFENYSVNKLSLMNV
ncbi:LOW QUALITY PROTEIN: hypothetical protein TorRG33x02_002180 [Trema orientale]|uniref:Uncharacterized protein n=1 Tax=Trema orientale TaxID=63057 RepID=A0A2P5G1H9_TREOI|nr:LOW QUALITY PROTEIN: hypothetical protein TorRG33x02_002180 [Trema orientale]